MVSTGVLSEGTSSGVCSWNVSSKGETSSGMRLQSACARGVRVDIRRKHLFLRKWDWISHPKPCIFLEEYSHFERGAPKPSPHPLKQSTCGGMAQGRNSGHAKSAYSSRNIHFSANLGVMGFALLGVLSYSSRKTPIYSIIVS